MISDRRLCLIAAGLLAAAIWGVVLEAMRWQWLERRYAEEAVAAACGAGSAALAWALAGRGRRPASALVGLWSGLVAGAWLRPTVDGQFTEAALDRQVDGGIAIMLTFGVLGLWAGLFFVRPGEATAVRAG